MSLVPLLYVLVAEVLACNIRLNGLISGLSLPGSSSSLPVISAYADDTTLVVSSVPSILAVFDVYSLYERGSGAKLNYGKCEGLLLGCWNGRTDSPVNITWSSVKVKVLGVLSGSGQSLGGQLEAAYHRGGKSFELLASAFVIL